MPPKQRLGKISEILRHDHVGTGLDRRRDDMQIAGIRPGFPGSEARDIAFDESVLEGALHGRSGASRPILGVARPTMAMNADQDPLDLVQHRRRPTQLEQVRLRERQEEVSLQSSDQRTRVDEGRNPGAHGSDQVRVEAGEIREGFTA